MFRIWSLWSAVDNVGGKLKGEGVLEEERGSVQSGSTQEGTDRIYSDLLRAVFSC